MAPVCIKVMGQCPECGQPVPMNALVTEMTCPTCTSGYSFTADAWSEILHHMLNQGHVTNGSIDALAYNVNLTYEEEDPRCGECDEAVPMAEAIAHAPQGFFACACGKMISIRPVPIEFRKPLLLRGFTHVVCEEREPPPGQVAATLDTPDATAPVAFPCPNCNASLRVDGTQRMVTCEYCRTTAYLPDDLWKRFHPIKKVSRYYLWRGDDVAVARPRQWETIGDAVVDTDGNLYCAAGRRGGDAFVLWSLDPKLNTRWVRRRLKYRARDVRLALTAGNLWVWRKGQRGILCVSAADGNGESVSELADLARCEDVAGDTDGSVIGVVGARLVRMAPPDEASLPMWEDESLATDSHSSLNVGFDGFLYRASGQRLVKYEPQGKPLYRIMLPSSIEGRPGADASGNAYVLCKVHDKPTILRVSPDGKRVQTAVKHREQGGSMLDERVLTVSPSGVAGVVGDDSQMQTFSLGANLLR